MDWDNQLGITEDEAVALKTVETERPAVSEVAVSTTQAAEMAKISLDFLAGLAMPTIFRYLFPPVFQAVWKWLLSYVHKSRDFSQLALGLPRGFGKTSVIKLFVLYCILFTNKKFILILCSNQTKANNIISDVIDMLDEPNIKKLFGDWKIGVQTDRQDLKKFGFRGRNIILMGAGADGDIRGIVLKNERPDLMIFDDIQSKKDAISETISRQLEDEMIGTAMKAKSPHGCLFVFIANMYPTKHSILRKLKHNPNWIKFIAGGILEDGTSLWEDLQPIKQLIREYENDLSMGHPEIFHAEVLNDENASANNLIDLSKVPLYNILDEDLHQGNFIVIDPASGRADGDAVSIMYFEVHDSVPVCKDLKEARLSPGDTISESLIMALEHNCNLIGIESNSYQYTLKYWFEFICLQRGIQGIDAVELYSGMTGKNARILAMFMALLKGEIRYHPKCAPAIHMQVTQFNAMKRDNVDGLLDCLTYAPKMIELYGHFMKANVVIEMQQDNSEKIGGVLETSAF
jgi:hypothetical protein